MRDVWSGNPDTDKFWASNEDLVRLRTQLDAQLARAKSDSLARFFEMADTARHFARVYRKLRLIK